MTAHEVVLNSRIDLENFHLHLPKTQLDRKLYTQVNSLLQFFGWSWVNQKQGFKPNGLLPRLLKGVQSQGLDPVKFMRTHIANTPKDVIQQFQFFETPTNLAEQMVDHLMISGTDKTLLEPSAGRGRIVDDVLTNHHEKLTRVDCVELNKYNAEMLITMSNDYWSKWMTIHTGDFLNCTAIARKTYDYVIANPPFTKNQDIKHIRKMYEHLKPGGRLVSLASKHWTFAKDSASLQFKEFCESCANFEQYEVEAGTFKAEGTSIASVIVVLDKDTD